MLEKPLLVSNRFATSAKAELYSPALPLEMHFTHLYVVTSAQLRQDVPFSKFQLVRLQKCDHQRSYISEEIQSVLTAQLAFMALSIRK